MHGGGEPGVHPTARPPTRAQARQVWVLVSHNHAHAAPAHKSDEDAAAQKEEGGTCRACGVRAGRSSWRGGPHARCTRRVARSPGTTAATHMPQAPAMRMHLGMRRRMMARRPVMQMRKKTRPSRKVAASAFWYAICGSSKWRQRGERGIGSCVRGGGRAVLASGAGWLGARRAVRSTGQLGREGSTHLGAEARVLRAEAGPGVLRRAHLVNNLLTAGVGGAAAWVSQE